MVVDITNDYYTQMEKNKRHSIVVQKGAEICRCLCCNIHALAFHLLPISMETHNEYIAHRITGWKIGDSIANVCWVWKVDKMFLWLLPFRLYALTAAESVLNVIVITSWLDEMVLAVMVCFVVCSQICLTSKRFVMWFSRAVELQEAKTTLSVIICSIIG